MQLEDNGKGGRPNYYYKWLNLAVPNEKLGIEMKWAMPRTSIVNYDRRYFTSLPDREFAAEIPLGYSKILIYLR